MNRINVLIADDHAIIRQGLKQILEMESDIVVVAQASNGSEAVRLIREKKPDVVLMDINMPTTDGIEAIKQLRQEGNQVKIIVLTIHEDREYLFKTLQQGAQGYVLKDADSSILIQAIRMVNNGQTYVQSSLTGELVKELNRITHGEKEKKDENSLTSREMEVLELIADGMMNRDIAKKLFISEKTVKNHISSIFRKLDVNDRTQAAIYAFKHNIKK